MLLTIERPLNEKLEFKGRIFNIDMSFDNVLTVFEIMDDNELNNAQKLLDTLYMLTGEEEFSPGYLDDIQKIEYASELRNVIFENMLNQNETEDEYLIDILGNKFKPPKNEEDTKENINELDN